MAQFDLFQYGKRKSPVEFLVDVQSDLLSDLLNRPSGSTDHLRNEIIAAMDMLLTGI